MINFSDKENLPKLITIEKSSLMSTLDIQKNLNKQVLIFMKSFVGNLEIPCDFSLKDTSVKYITQATLILNKSNFNIKSIKKLITYLGGISENLNTLSSFELDNMFSTYNSNFNTTINYVYKNTQSIEDFIHEISLIDAEAMVKTINEQAKQIAIDKENEKNEQNNLSIQAELLESAFLENTLIISDYKKKVFLPYTIENVKNILFDNPSLYTSLQDVIDKVYTKSYDYYKFSPIARFKETYNLLHRKEKKSRLKSIPMAVELFFNYNLHPAIISSCNTLDELDIFLACLEDNTLEDFHYFDIKFEIPPTVISINIT